MPLDEGNMFEVGTLGAMASRVERWARERIDADVLADAINDAIESLWMAASLATLSKFVGRPIQQLIPSQSQEFQLISLPDPTDYLEPGAIVSGALPARQYTVAYSLVTDSGTETLPCSEVVANLDANTLLAVPPPPSPADACGWNLYAGVNGHIILQNPTPNPFNRTWIEPPLGISLAPDGPQPRTVNNTGDNIFSITRIDIANQDQTLTNWLQTTIGSSAFTMFQNRYPLASTFPRHAYDLISNGTVEFRPAAGTDLDATLFYIVRPRRLRFPISRLPFTSFASQPYIFRQALADVLLSLNEDDTADRWEKKAAQSKLEVVMSIVGESWDRNTTVKPYMRY